MYTSSVCVSEHFAPACGHLLWLVEHPFVATVTIKVKQESGIRYSKYYCVICIRNISFRAFTREFNKKKQLEKLDDSKLIWLHTYN